MSAKKKVLRLDPQASCRVEPVTYLDVGGPTQHLEAVVRDAKGGIIGQHRTTMSAWDMALARLQIGKVWVQ